MLKFSLSHDDVIILITQSVTGWDDHADCDKFTQSVTGCDDGMIF
jgi:hypothetical protein